MSFAGRYSALLSEPACSRCTLCQSPKPHGRHASSVRHAVERDLDWEPVINKPNTAPQKSNFSRPPPPPPPPPRRTPKTLMDWIEAPFTSRRNIALTMLAGAAGLWFYNKKLLPPVQIGQPPADFPFQLAGYTDIAPEEFVYAKTPGGHWIAAATDPQGRLYMIDEIGDLYYDSGSPQIGLYAMDRNGNLFNFYQDVDGSRKITPVGNVADLKKFKVSEIAGVKLDRDVTVVAFQDGSSVELPAGAGAYDKDGKFVPPGELIEGLTVPQENPFARLMGSEQTREYPLWRYEVDLNDPTPFNKQLFDQTLLDDPDVPGFQPALPSDFSLEDLAKEVAEEAKYKKK
eukprot:jgi/Chrzof1/6781/Cz19g09070.t1